MCSTDFGLSYAKKGELLPYIIKVLSFHFLTTGCFVLAHTVHNSVCIFLQVIIKILRSFAVDIDINLKNIIEGLRAKRAYIAFLADFHFLQDRANFWQTDLF